MKRKDAKNIFVSFAKRSEKEAKRFLFRFEAKKNKKRKWDTLPFMALDIARAHISVYLRNMG